MAEVKFADASYPLGADESVLDALLRHQHNIPYACKSGVCQACMVKAVAGTPSARSQTGLKPTLKAEGYALACQWVPESDVEVRLPGLSEDAALVVISSMDRLNADVMRLILTPKEAVQMFSGRPGQYLNLVSPDGVTRSYSIANDMARDGHIELHVANTPLGLFTHWLFNTAKPGDELYARGPAGTCFYTAEETADFPMLLAGTGTGLAPLYGIVHDALGKGHRGNITLLHGGSIAERFYYVDELRQLAANHPNFHYEALVLAAPEGDARLKQGDIEQAALATLDSAALASQRVFLCGAPDFVQGLRKKIFLKGVRSANIYCDAFVTRKVECA